MVRALTLLVWLVILVFSAPAIAQDSSDDGERVTLSGTWNASGLSESWSTQDWGEPCGPKPASQGAGGGTVQITEVGGELSIVGAGRAFSTAECWEQMPGMSRTSHSASGNGRFWQTRCATPANDPRQATVTTTIQATDDSITMIENGSYEFNIQGQACTASVSRSRSFSIVQRAGEAASDDEEEEEEAEEEVIEPEKPTPVASPPPSVCEGGPGEPARLEVTPSRKLLRAGETFAFTARVLDERGCSVGVRPSVRLEEGPLASHATVSPEGEVSVAGDAPEGTLEVVFAIQSRGVTVAIDVASADNYDALLTTRGFNADGEIDEAAIVLIATTSIGGPGGVAANAEEERKRVFLAVVGAVVAALGLVGLVLIRRGRRRADREADEPEPSVAPNVALFQAPEGVAMRCPSCGEHYPPKSAFCAADGSALEPDPDAPVPSAAPPSSMAASTASPPSGPATVGAGPGQSSAPPPGLGASGEPVRKKKRRSICPTCGTKYPADSKFCGKDGTVLVPLNQS